MNSFAKNTRKKEEVTRDGTYAVVQKISEAFYDGHSVVYADIDNENYYDIRPDTVRSWNKR